MRSRIHAYIRTARQRRAERALAAEKERRLSSEKRLREFQKTIDKVREHVSPD